MRQEHSINIKGMVCNRCILAIDSAFQSVGLEIKSIRLGEVTVISQSQPLDIYTVEDILTPLGFEVIEDKVKAIVRQVKTLVEEVYSGSFDFPEHFRFSALLSSRLNRDYDAISSAFSAVEGTTIEKYIIDYRINKIKESLLYSSESLFDIAFRLGFSSVAHLSKQFKTVTGVNTSVYKSSRGVVIH